MRDPDLHDALAKAVGYPDEGFLASLDRCVALAGGKAGAPLRRFRDRCVGRRLEELQELYTQTFDLDPACSMEIGWHLHGENYARGEFLVEMRRALRKHGVAEGTELPDHLTHVLPVLARMPSEEAARLAVKGAAPALDKILEGLKGRDCLYEDLVRATRDVVGEADHG